MEKRSAYWDNVKAILIFLVVLGHFLLAMQKKSVLVEAVYWWIYSFHMPAFVFASGYFAKSFVKKNGDRSRLLGFLIVYVVFTILLWIMNMINTKEFRLPSLFSTGSAQWYMLAMFVWYLLLLFAAGFSGKVSIPVAFLIGLLVGIDENAGNFLSMSRIIVFFPFFLSGYYFKGECLEKITKLWKVLGAVFLSAVFVVLLYFRKPLTPLLRCVYGDKSYAAMELTSAEGIFFRGMWYFFAVCMIAALLCVVSSRRHFYTYIGEYTLPIYVIHRVLRDVFSGLGLFSIIGDGIVALAVCCILSITIVFLCANKTIGKIFDWAFRIGKGHEISRNKINCRN